MTDETQRTLITVTGTLSAVGLGSVLTNWLASRRDKRKAELEAITALQNAKRKALSEVLASLYAVDLALTQANLKRHLASTVKANADESAQSFIGFLGRADVASEIKQGMLKEMTVAKERNYELLIEGFEHRTDFLRFTTEAVRHAAEYGDYPACFPPLERLTDALHWVGSVVSKHESWDVGSHSRNFHFKVIDDIKSLMDWETRCVVAAQSGQSQPTTGIPRFVVLSNLQEAMKALDARKENLRTSD